MHARVAIHLSTLFKLQKLFKLLKLFTHHYLAVLNHPITGLPDSFHALNPPSMWATFV